MERIVLFVLIGLGAQLVDGTLGMAFGVTATTLFILSGAGAATASAVVHVVEVGTTLASGASHWRFGNVDWGRALRLGVPGAIGAFLGATFLSSLDGDAAKPVTSSILLALGLWVLVRFAFLPPRRNAAAASWGLSKLGPLGLAGGLLDATGGGGWGPVTTSTMLSAGADQPRKIIGTVSAAEFLVTVAATLGFLPLLREEFAEHTLPILGLLVGGVLAARPIALAASAPKASGRCPALRRSATGKTAIGVIGLRGRGHVVVGRRVRRVVRRFPWLAHVLRSPSPPCHVRGSRGHLGPASGSRHRLPRGPENPSFPVFDDTAFAGVPTELSTGFVDNPGERLLTERESPGRDVEHQLRLPGSHCHDQHQRETAQVTGVFPKVPRLRGWRRTRSSRPALPPELHLRVVFGTG